MTLLHKIGAGVVLLAAVFIWHMYDKQSAVSAAERALTIKLQHEQAYAVLNAIADTQESQDKVIAESIKVTKERDVKIKTLNSSLAVAISSLQQRPGRTEQHTNNPEATGTCTGRELSREDAEFLTREAASAEKLIYERDYYFNEYENVRIQLEQLRLKGSK